MNGKIELTLPSPLQELDHPLFLQKKLHVYLKRDDLIHPLISGNKWRKLKYNVEAAAGRDLLTFGGAYSNHIAASATACNFYGLNSIGLIRGEKTLPLNPTLAFAEEQGMRIEYVSRQEYKQKSNPDFIKKIKNEYNNPFIVPEGGANYNGIKGCKEVIDEIDMEFDYIISAVGTGATIAGLALGLKTDQKVIGISSLKSAFSLSDEIDDYINIARKGANEENYKERVELMHDYHFGGYAKINDQLIDFMRSFYSQFGVKTDPVYSAKSLYALFDLVEQDYFPENTVIIYYHCGGLQGIPGIEKRYNLKIF